MFFCTWSSIITTTCASSTAEPLVQVNGKPSCCFFKFSPKLMFTKVLKAQLWVYLRPLQQTSTVYLQILRLKPVTEQGSRHIRIRSLKIELNSRVGHWQSIDFKHVLQNWFKQPHTNWGIDINAFDESGNDLAVTSLRPGEEGLSRSDTGDQPAEASGFNMNISSCRTNQSG
ncbi:hypothetical protein INR49_006606 [Caranx melampygus]|nr:hypothetical protein INR49_006606 [Caranx melampygus]